MNTISGLLLVVLAQAASPPAADPQAKAAAQALLKEGTILYEGGDCAAALEKFEAAYGVYASPKLLFNIGQADRELGRPVDAVQAFEKFLALTPDAAPEILSEARQSVADLKAKLGQVKVECATSGAEVSIDGKAVGMTPLDQPIWLPPGRHQIGIRHQGFSPVVANVTAGTSQTVTLEPRWKPISAAGTPAVMPTTSPAPMSESPETAVVAPGHDKNWWSGRKWFVWAAAGGTAAFATGAIVAGLAANSRFNDLQNTCGGTTAGCSESQIDSVKSRAALANVFWVLAGASALTTGVSFYLDSREAGVSVAWKF